MMGRRRLGDGNDDSTMMPATDNGGDKLTTMGLLARFPRRAAGRLSENYGLASWLKLCLSLCRGATEYDICSL